MGNTAEHAENADDAEEEGIWPEPRISPPRPMGERCLFHASSTNGLLEEAASE